MDAETANELKEVIRKRLSERGLTEDIIKEIIKSNPKSFDSKYEDIIIKHFDFRK